MVIIIIIIIKAVKLIMNRISIIIAGRGRGAAPRAPLRLLRAAGNS